MPIEIGTSIFIVPERNARIALKKKGCPAKPAAGSAISAESQ